MFFDAAFKGVAGLNRYCVILIFYVMDRNEEQFTAKLIFLVQKHLRNGRQCRQHEML